MNTQRMAVVFHDQFFVDPSYFLPLNTHEKPIMFWPGLSSPFGEQLTE